MASPRFAVHTPVDRRFDNLVTVYPSVPPLSAEERWNEALLRLEGNLLQSWRWGEFKIAQGWEVERLHRTARRGEWLAQVLIKQAGPLALAYIPCGPTLRGDHAAIFPAMVAELDELCGAASVASLLMEPNQRLELPGTYKDHGFVAWREPMQPRHTWQVLALPDDELLAAMHHKKRYHVRLAQRHGYAVERREATPENIVVFHEMLVATAERQGIPAHSPDYLTDQLRAFGDHAALFFVTDGGQPLAAAIFARFGEEATYLSAASVIEKRGQGAGALLIYEATRWFRDQGCTRVDLGNIGPEGLRAFKTGFGGVASAFPTSMERRYHALRSWAVRRVIATRG